MNRSRSARQRARRAVAITAILVAAAIGATTPNTGQALDRAVTRRVQPAAVQLGPIFSVQDAKTGKPVRRVIGWGSGTIIDARGNIVTNAHVTDLRDFTAEAAEEGVTVEQDVVAVLIPKRTDQPAIPVFVADVIGQDEDLDIAVVRISKTFAGEPVDLETVNLPTVPLGDSDAVELGDTINVFGYPGIGGATVTYTSGPVSGFAADAVIPGRAWIKTSASISGGNSGGTGVDDDGRLIGVPTRTGVEGAGGFVDCRALADTNRDGKIDGKDTCVPTGGFLNSLRAINVAKEMIAANTGAETAPTDPTAPTTPTEPGVAPPGEDEAPVPGRTPPPPELVRITGRVTDAATGRPVAGAVYLVLRAGVTWDNVAGETDVLDTAISDRNGRFELGTPLVRGEQYSSSVTAGPRWKPFEADRSTVPRKGVNPIALDIRLDPR
jgi:hypothetical protein